MIDIGMSYGKKIYTKTHFRASIAIPGFPAPLALQWWQISTKPSRANTHDPLFPPTLLIFAFTCHFLYLISDLSRNTNVCWDWKACVVYFFVRSSSSSFVCFFCISMPITPTPKKKKRGKIIDHLILSQKMITSLFVL